MSILNQYVCAAAGGNTGVPDCAIQLKDLKKGFLVPSSFELTATDLATPESALAALQAASVNDDPALRIYPLPQFEEVTDNTEDVVTEAIGGTNFIVRDGKYNLLVRYVKGGQCVSNALRKFVNFNGGIIFVDSAGVVAGWKSGTSLKGIPLNQFYPNPARIATSTTIANYSFTVSFEAAYFNEGLGFIQLNPADIFGISGLQNIVLSLVAPRSTTTFRLRTTTGCAAIDLYDQYGADLADTSNFVVTRNGAVVTVTSIATDANTKSLLFTLDSTDPDYNAAGPFLVSGAGVSALVSNDVEGYEILPLLVS